jgi:hypothetical protein
MDTPYFMRDLQDGVIVLVLTVHKL